MLNSPQLEQDRNLVLIGYRATGKSSVGACLARTLNRPFVDLDRVLVQEAGKSIADVVAAGGWEEFRRLEKELVARLGTAKGLVLATGGGVILDPENVRVLRQHGIIVWLTAPPAIIQARLAQDQPQSDSRPSLTGADTIREVTAVLTMRQPLYEAAAQITVDTAALSLDQVVEQVLAALKGREEAASGG
jgi:shikimate kinase